MNSKPLSILLAEDDPSLGLLLTDYLEAEGFTVNLCRDGEEALKAICNDHYHLCLLDVMMPKLDGFSLAGEIRLRDKNVPVIFITAKSLKEDKLKGYGLGADDYISKPFDEEELLCKIKAVIRRNQIAGNEKKTGPVFIGKYIFDLQNQSLSLDGKIRRITERECEIINYLSDRRNRIIKREDMLRELWGKNDYFLGRSLDVFLTKIRKYLQDDPTVNIENVFKVGFIFNVPVG